MSSYQHSIKLPSVMGSSFSKGMKQFKKDIIIEGSSDRVSICLNAMSATAIAYSAGSTCDEMNSAGSTCNEVNCLSITHNTVYMHTHAFICTVYIHPTCLPSAFFDFRFFALFFLDLTLFFGKESSMDEAGRFLDDELGDIFGGFNKHREFENCRSKNGRGFLSRFYATCKRRFFVCNFHKVCH